MHNPIQAYLKKSSHFIEKNPTKINGNILCKTLKLSFKLLFTTKSDTPIPKIHTKKKIKLILILLSLKKVIYS